MKVADLTVEQFMFLIEEIVDRKLGEYLGEMDDKIKLPPQMTEEMKAARRARRGQSRRCGF